MNHGHPVSMQRRKFSSSVLRVVLLQVAIVGGTAAAQAQTLDEQYEFYLATVSQRCQNMGFARDAFATLLPGQAGPNLTAYCSGPPLVGGGGTATNSSGGGAGAGAGRGSGAQEDAALRRRREKLRQTNNTESADTSSGSGNADLDLASFGSTSLFVSFDYLHERQKSTHYETGRQSHSLDSTLGADHRFGTQGLAGLALKYAAQSGDIDSGGDFNTHDHGLWAYGSWLPHDSLFFDAAVGLDVKQVQTQRIVFRQLVTTNFLGTTSTVLNPTPQPASSDTHSHEVSAELHSGYDFSHSSVTIGPRIALTYRHASLDAFLESGNTPMTLAFDTQTSTSMRSLVGLQLSKAFTVSSGALVPQLNVDWVHEYRDEQRVITARFAEDLRAAPAKLRFLNQAPDRDWAAIRINTVAVFTHGFSAFAAFETMAGHAYIDRYRASLGMRMEL
jgi:uncharacterized protein YhjY with autotransporter beta-barrel domain